MKRAILFTGHIWTAYCYAQLLVQLNKEILLKYIRNDIFLFSVYY